MLQTIKCTLDKYSVHTYICRMMKVNFIIKKHLNTQCCMYVYQVEVPGSCLLPQVFLL